jgi:hypothetical protein
VSAPVRHMRACVACMGTCVIMTMHSFFVRLDDRREESVGYLVWSKALSLCGHLHISFMIKDKKSLKQWILGQICSDSILCYIWTLHYTQMDRENIYEFCSSFAFTFITVNPYYCPLLYSLNVF